MDHKVICEWPFGINLLFSFLELIFHGIEKHILLCSLPQFTVFYVVLPLVAPLVAIPRFSFCDYFDSHRKIVLCGLCGPALIVVVQLKITAPCWEPSD